MTTRPVVRRLIPAMAAVLVCAGAMRRLDARAGSQSPVRDVASRPASVGTASVTGTVVSDDERQSPVRHATMTLSRVGVSDSWVLATDDQGRYAFTDLPAATYVLSATKGAFLPAGYGVTKIGASSVPIPLKDGQQFVAQPLIMVRGAVITGRIVDVNGRPLANARVRASTIQTVNGERQLGNAFLGYGNASTDSRGAYRVYGLPAGEYVFMVSPPSETPAMTMTVAEQQWAQQHQSGAATTPAPLPPPSRPFVAAPTYFPGTAELSAAAVITLGKAEERSGVDVTLIRVGVARVKGGVTDVDGQPVSGAILVRSAKSSSPSNPVVSVNFNAQSRTAPDGSFLMNGVTPGSYMIVARAGAQTGRAGAAGSAGEAPAPISPIRAFPSGPMTLWGQADVTVNGDDIEDVAIRLQPAMTVSGSLAFDATTPVPTELARFQPRLVASQRAPSIEVSGGTPPVPNADRTFKIEGIVPGTYRMSGYGSTPAPFGQTPNAWWIKSAVRDGRDLLDTPFEIRPGEDLTGVVVTYTDRRTELNGTLVDAKGQPVAQFVLFAFSTNRARWDTDSVGRWTTSARAGADGTFRFIGLPPGEYYVCALTELDPAQRSDAAFLETLVAASYKVTLSEGEKKSQTFRVGG